LIEAGVASRRVMSASLDEHNRAWREFLDRALQAFPVEALLGRVVVWKVAELDIERLENVPVIDWKNIFSIINTQDVRWGSEEL
jgi:hypothetical protein